MNGLRGEKKKESEAFTRNILERKNLNKTKNKKLLKNQIRNSILNKQSGIHPT